MDSIDYKRLPLRAEPYPDESINGYIARTAVRNHAARASQVLQIAGLKSFKQCYSDKEIEQLAHTTGQDFDTLRAIAPTPKERSPLGPVSRLLGQEIPTNALVRVGRRICPICIADSPHHRISWTLRFIRVCPLHGARLLNTCTSCGKGLSWSTVSPNSCQCGSEFVTQLLEVWKASRTFDAMLSPAVPDELEGPTKLLAYLTRPSIPQQPLLQKMSFAETLIASRYLGQFGAPPEQSYRLDDTIWEDIGIWHTRGMRLLSLDPSQLGPQLISLARMRQGWPTRKYLDALTKLHETLTASGSRDRPLPQAIGDLLNRLPIRGR